MCIRDRLYIEGPVDAGNKPDQIRLLTAITKELTRLGSGVKIVADEWCNTCLLYTSRCV